MSARGRGPGIISQVRESYPDFRAAMARKLAAVPREAELLSYAFLAGAIGFAAGLPSAMRQAAALEGEDIVAGVLAGRLFAAVFLFPLLLYLLSAVAHLAARAAGGTGGYAAARIVTFWSVVLALPLVLAGGLASALADLLPKAIGTALTGGVSTLTSLGFAWIWAAGIAEAEGFQSARYVFATIVAISLTLWFATLLFLRN